MSRRKQEVKIVNTENNTSVFFFAHSFKTADEHSLEYVKRNRNKFPMTVYRINEGVGHMWVFVRSI